jgi:uncharacterized protein YaaR (DUF327 family)
MKEILQDLLDDLEFFVNSRESNKDVKHIDEIIKKYKNKAINYNYCCKSDSELLCGCENPKTKGWYGDAYMCECGKPYIEH